MKKTLLLVILALLVSSTLAIELKVNPSRLEEVDANILLSNKGYITGNILRGTRLEVKTLTFQPSIEQEIKSIEERLLIDGKEITPAYEYDEQGNKYALFKAYDIQDKEFEYYVKARIKRKSFLYRLQDNSLEDLENLGKEEQVFVLDSEHIEASDATIQTLAGFVSDKNTVLGVTSDVLEWVYSYLSYDAEYYTVLNSALETYEQGKGTCDEFSNLAAALLRAKGIPTKYVVSVVYDGIGFGMHAFLKVFSPSRGWIPIDATFFEAGLVDAGHVVLAEFIDQEQAKDVITTAANLQVRVEKNTDVKVNSFKTFDPLFYKTELNPSPRLNGGQDFSLGVQVMNSSSSAVLFPLELAVHPGFSLADNKARMAFILPGEEKSIEWSLTAPEGREGLVVKYDYRIDSFDQEITGKVSVVGFLEEKAKAWLVVKEVKPFVEEGKAFVIVEVTNIGSLEGEAIINIDGNVESFFIAPGALISERFEIGDKESFSIRITGEGLDYTKKVNILEKPLLKEDIIGWIPQTTTGERNTEEAWLMALSVGVLVGILLVMGIVLLALRKRGF